MDDYKFIAQIKGAFLEDQIIKYGEVFDDFLRELINFAKKNSIFYNDFGLYSEKALLDKFAEHLNRSLNIKETGILENLFKRKRLEYPNLFMQVYKLINPEIDKTIMEELKNGVSKQFGFDETAWEKIMHFLTRIAERFDLKTLQKNEETNVFFDKLINAFLMEDFPIDLKNEEWSKKIEDFGVKWGFNKEIIRKINSKTMKDDSLTNFQSACSEKLNYIQTEILEKDKQKWPYCLLVRIFLVGAVEIFVGTGFFIEDHHLMTALHLFYEKTGEKKRFDKYKFRIMYYDGEQPEDLGPISPKCDSFRFPETLENAIDEKKKIDIAITIDIAILKVKRDGGKILEEKGGNGFFEPSIITEEDIGSVCTLVGYWPKLELEKNNNFIEEEKKDPHNPGLFCDIGHIKEIEKGQKYRFIHLATGYSGQSGSPFYRIEKGKLQLFGVHQAQGTVEKGYEYLLTKKNSQIIKPIIEGIFYATRFERMIKKTLLTFGLKLKKKMNGK